MNLKACQNCDTTGLVDAQVCPDCGGGGAVRGEQDAMGLVLAAGDRLAVACGHVAQIPALRLPPNCDGISTRAAIGEVIAAVGRVAQAVAVLDRQVNP